jgi:hypothetical protein
MVSHWRASDSRRQVWVAWPTAWSRWRSPKREAAQVTLRHAFLPQRFRWRGALHSVCAIERVWERSTPQPCRFYRVRCQQGEQVTLVQDLQVGVWYAYR